jgi:Zn-dependent protease
MADQPRSSRDEILIALAGPAVSFALAGLGWVLYAATGATFFYLIGWINTLLGAFNLIPAMPMDGGRVLRALLTRRFSFVKATDIAVKVARGFAIVLGIYGVATGQIYLALLAVVLWLMGSAELRAARLFGYSGGGARVGEVEVLDPAWSHQPRGGAWDPLAALMGTMQPPPGRKVRVHRVGNRTFIEVID